MMSRVASTASIRPVWRRFRHNRRGSAAVEFALVAPVFFALLFAIIETGIIFFAGQILQTVATRIRAHDPDRSDSDRGPYPGAVSKQCRLPVHSGLAQLRQPLSSTSSPTSSFSRLRPVNNESSPTAPSEHQHAVQSRRPRRCCCLEAVLSMAAVRHRARLQYLEFGRTGSGCLPPPLHFATSHIR